MDGRKTLGQLREEWQNCTACDLGQRRQGVGGAFVFGEGVRGKIMLIGEGPGEQEEASGRPFVGPSGKLLRAILEGLKIAQDVYITNIVACRSCTQATDADGNLIFRRGRKGGPREPLWKDEAPQPHQAQACLARLHEEIYLVDPQVIVLLGGTATETLLSKKVAITQVRGEPERLSIPGASFAAVLTDKRQAWLRKQNGVLVLPTRPNLVHYYCLPTVHPAWVLRKIADQGSDSPFRRLFDDIRLAVHVYERHTQIVCGREPTMDDDGAFERVLESYEAGEE